MRNWLAIILFLTSAGLLSAYDTAKDSSGVYIVVLEPGNVSMQVNLPAPSGTLLDGNTSYSPPVLAAMQLWNNSIGAVQLQGQTTTSTSYTNGNRVNEIAMDSKVDGDDFGSSTVAITISYRSGGFRTESDIIFNTAYTWDSYRGSQRSGRQDIQRVAVHELGHVLGLIHPNEADPPQSVTAIMNSRVSSVETPQADDISGAQSLYGAPGQVPSNNNFANARALVVSSGSAQATGNNIAATAETNEPRHAGETPTHSVWWRWVATSSDPATLTTFGSNFDTVVGVYTGSSPGALTSIASNDDEDRGVIRSSKLTFTPTTGVTYYIAVDGWDGTYGQITMNLTTSASTGTPPVITSAPASQSVTSGGTVTYSVSASGAPTGYQWYFNGSPISGETSSSLTLNNVTSSNAGSYYVIVTNASGSTTSSAATLTILTASVTNQVVTTGHDVSLTAPSLTGSYQWQVSSDNGSTWNDVSNNGTYSGATTATLTISGAGSSLDGNDYRYVVTNGVNSSSSGAIGLSVNALLIPFPVAIAMDTSGNLYVGDSSIHTVHKITTANQVSTLAGSSGLAGSVDGSGSTARFNQPSGISSTSAGLLTVVDTSNAQIRRVTAAGVVSTLAGSATNRGNTDGSGATATFGMPIGIAQNSSGTFTIADGTNHTVRQMSSANVVSTLAGSSGSSGSIDGAGTNARFNYPTGVAIDSSGNIYIADTTNNLIRKITSTGNVTTLAGVVGVSGWQDGTGGGALFNQPGGLTTDNSGNVYVADTGNSAVRKITPAGVVTTLAGLSTIGGLQDGVGSEAWFNQPKDLVSDASGNLYVADTGNAVIRKVTPNGTVTTLALTAAPVTTTGGSSGGSSGGGSTTTTVPSGGGGGGGGGGAPSIWFVGAVSLLALLHRRILRAD